MFGFWDWVGGRYSIWSSIGLLLAIGIGKEKFDEFLRGGQDIDSHFVEAPLERNIPVLMEGIWYRDFWGYAAHAVIPYDERMARFRAYLQQLEMESNGKSVDLTGARARAEQALGASSHRLHYLSVPPNAALSAVRLLDEAGLVERSQIIMEKPFGTDLASAVLLNTELRKVFS